MADKLHEDPGERSNPDAFDLDRRDIALPRDENYTRIEIRPGEAKLLLYRDDGDEEATEPDEQGPPETFAEAERRGMYQSGPNPTAGE